MQAESGESGMNWSSSDPQRIWLPILSAQKSGNTLALKASFRANFSRRQAHSERALTESRSLGYKTGGIPFQITYPFVVPTS